jgi:acetyltransferase AlgX (SGNH hydrolase-like protein)
MKNPNSNLPGYDMFFVKYAVTLVFLILIFLPAISQITGLFSDIEANEKTEARKYEARPQLEFELEKLKTYPDRFEKYFRNQFGFRRPLVDLNNFLSFRVFKVSPAPLILLGKDGWFFWGYGKRRVQKGVQRPANHIADHMGIVPYTEEDLKGWKRSLEERMYYLKEMGIPFVFAVAPAKRMLYPEYLPTLLRSLKKTTRMEQLNDYLANHSEVNVVDLYDYMLARKDDHDQPYLFLKTDGHWNMYGALLGYQGIMEKVDSLLPDKKITPLVFEDFDIKYRHDWSHRRFCAKLGNNIVEDYPAFFPKTGKLIGDVPIVDKARAKKEMKKFGLDVNGRIDFLGDVGIGILPIPGRLIKDINGIEQGYQVIDFVKGTPLKHIHIFSDSFIQKALWYFAGHAELVTFTRQILDFDTHIFNYEVLPDVVIESVNQGYLFREAPVNPPEVKEAYLRYKFERSKESILSIDTTIGEIVKKGLPINWEIKPELASGMNQTSVLKVSFKTTRHISLAIRHLSKSKEEKNAITVMYKRKTKAMHFEIPSLGKTDTLQLHFNGALIKQGSRETMIIEIRAIDQ